MTATVHAWLCKFFSFSQDLTVNIALHTLSLVIVIPSCILFQEHLNVKLIILSAAAHRCILCHSIDIIRYAIYAVYIINQPCLNITYDVTCILFVFNCILLCLSYVRFVPTFTVHVYSCTPPLKLEAQRESWECMYTCTRMSLLKMHAGPVARRLVACL